jgi:transcriptional regulator with XRE-family HTH domain
LEAGTNRVRIQYLETGKREPELATLLVLADALAVSLDEGRGSCGAAGAAGEAS